MATPTSHPSNPPDPNASVIEGLQSAKFHIDTVIAGLTSGEIACTDPACHRNGVVGIIQGLKDSKSHIDTAITGLASKK
jgi:hypothetical protein